MEKTTVKDIQSATDRYSKALIADLEARERLVKDEIEKIKTHSEVVLAFQDLQALRFNSN